MKRPVKSVVRASWLPVLFVRRCAFLGGVAGDSYLTCSLPAWRAAGLPATAARGGDRGGWRRRAGAGSWLTPLPGSYSRVGTAGRLFAGRCPSLTARVGSLKTFTGIIPAAACVPARRRLKGGGQLVISAHTNPASSRAAATTATPAGLPRAVSLR